MAVSGKQTGKTALLILQSGIIDRENKWEFKKIIEAMQRLEG